MIVTVLFKWLITVLVWPFRPTSWLVTSPWATGKRFSWFVELFSSVIKVLNIWMFALRICSGWIQESREVTKYLVTNESLSICLWFKDKGWQNNWKIIQQFVLDKKFKGNFKKTCAVALASLHNIQVTQLNKELEHKMAKNKYLERRTHTYLCLWNITIIF